MPGIRTSAITYRRGISNSTPNFFLIAQANYVIPQPTSRFRQPVPTPAAAPVTPYAPTPDTTILEYLTDQVVTIFVWSGVTFTRDTNLPGFCYTAITTAIPGTTVPQAVASISSITIGNIVTSIGTNAFLGCTNSESLTFTPTSTLTSIGANAFQNGLNPPSIFISITIPNSVTSIGTNAFRNCASLESVTLPTNPLFISINTSAFQACGLKSITIPNSVTSIGTSAFSGCTLLASVTLPTNPLFISIGSLAFRLCSFTSITIPNSVTSILSNAFVQPVDPLLGLKTVTIANPSQIISGITFTAGTTVLLFFGATNVTIV